MVAGTLWFTFPANEGAGCDIAAAPCTDLDSVYLWRQDAILYPYPRIIKRAGVRGLEGQPYSFSYECLTPPCQYYVTTTDERGNQSCPSPIVQIGGAVSVPTRAATVPRSGRFDLQGRRMSSRAQGVYWRPDSLRLRVLR